MVAQYKMEVTKVTKILPYGPEIDIPLEKVVDRHSDWKTGWKLAEKFRAQK